MSDVTKLLSAAAAWIRGAERITVLTGSGIGSGSRGLDSVPHGGWPHDPASPRLFTLRAYREDPEVRREVWRRRRAHSAWTARPNAAHYALVELETRGTLQALITQNIDGLHQLAGTSEELLIEVHGSLYQVECLSCDATAAMSDTLERVGAGDDDPACLRCGGILKARVISWGQPLNSTVFAAASEAARGCDLFLAIGTPLTAEPVASLVPVAKEAGARVVILHPEPTPYDRLAEFRLEAPASTLLPLLVAEAASDYSSPASA
jgi:NAD-dependent deacetylase